MGLPGVAYFTGLKEAFWTAFGALVGTYLNWLFVAKRLRVYTIQAHNSITIPEFLSNRFHAIWSAHGLFLRMEAQQFVQARAADNRFHIPLLEHIISKSRYDRQG